MSTIGNRLTVDQYDLMVANGILPEVTYLELVEGRIVEKCHMSPPSACAAEQCAEVLRGIVPKGWYVRQAGPVRIPTRDSEPEPEVSVVHGHLGHTGRDIQAPRMSPWSSRLRGGATSTSTSIAPWPRPTAPAASRSTGL